VSLLSAYDSGTGALAFVGVIAGVLQLITAKQKLIGNII
jgi:hypothetical protein